MEDDVTLSPRVVNVLPQGAAQQPVAFQVGNGVEQTWGDGPERGGVSLCQVSFNQHMEECLLRGGKGQLPVIPAQGWLEDTRTLMDWELDLIFNDENETTAV